MFFKKKIIKVAHNGKGKLVVNIRGSIPAIRIAIHTLIAICAKQDGVTIDEMFAEIKKTYHERNATDRQSVDNE